MLDLTPVTAVCSGPTHRAGTGPPWTVIRPLTLVRLTERRSCSPRAAEVPEFTVAKPLRDEAAVLIALALSLAAALLYIRALRTRGRTLMLAAAENQRREARRRAFCATVGHDLDEACLCRRCLATRHDYVTIHTQSTALFSRLVNPDADPGALWLDSNFQPDYDYGRTETLYRVERDCRCARCGHDLRTVEQTAVPDEPSGDSGTLG